MVRVTVAGVNCNNQWKFNAIRKPESTLIYLMLTDHCPLRFCEAWRETWTTTTNIVWLSKDSFTSVFLWLNIQSLHLVFLNLLEIHPVLHFSSLYVNTKWFYIKTVISAPKPRVDSFGSHVVFVSTQPWMKSHWVLSLHIELQGEKPSVINNSST